MQARTLVYVKFLFAAFSLVVLFHFVPLGETVAALRDLDPVWFAIAVITQFVMRAVGTLRMQVVAANQGITLSLPQLYRLLLTVHFYSVLLPGPLVGGGASWIKYKQHGASSHAAAATVLINRAVGIGMKITLGVCAWLLDQISGTPIFSFACVLAVLFMFALAVLTPPPHGVEQRPAGDSRLGRFVHEMFRRVILFGRIPRFGKFVILTSALVQELLGTFLILGFGIAVGRCRFPEGAVDSRGAIDVSVIARHRRGHRCSRGQPGRIGRLDRARFGNERSLVVCNSGRYADRSCSWWARRGRRHDRQNGAAPRRSPIAGRHETR